MDSATSQHLRGTRSSDTTRELIILEGKDKSVLEKNTASEKAAASIMKAEAPDREAKTPKKEVKSPSYTPTQDCILLQ